jgi:hypothetical protein
MRLIQEDGSLCNFLKRNARTPLAPLGFREGGACGDEGGTLPGAYPNKKKERKHTKKQKKTLKKRDKSFGGFELTVGRNTAIQGIMP